MGDAWRIVAVVVLLATGRALADEVEFATGLDRVEALMGRGKWQDALSSLKDVLDEHARRPYVAAERARIEEDVRRCVFRVETQVPTIENLIKGEILSYDRRTGQIKLRYLRSPADKDVHDFQTGKGGLLSHPVLFDGPYTIEFKGPSYPTIMVSGSRPPKVYCGFENDEYLVVCFGFERRTHGSTVHHHAAYIARQRGDDGKILDEKDATPCKSGAKFSIKVQVGATSVSALYNGRKFLSGPKSKDVYGTIAFEDIRGWTEILISGDAQTSWVQEREDAAEQAAQREFQKTYRPADHLPDWFIRGEYDRPEPPHALDAPDAGIAQESRLYPGESRSALDSLYRAARQHIDRGDYEAGLAYVEEKKDLMTPALAAYLAAWCSYELGDHDAALRLCEQVEAEDGEFTGAKRIRLRIQLARGVDAAAAEAEWRGLLERHPTDPDLYHELVQHVLHHGRVEDAKELTGLALRRGIGVEEFTEFDRNLAIALKGPDWSTRFEHRSKNYHVVSDIDVATCREAAKLLEEAYAAYVNRLRNVPGLENRKFFVFLFSGSGGYQTHIERVLQGLGGAPPFHTAGVYTPTFKQLFIWNQRDRADMMRTVRHEGFHQYLDRVVADAPLWFNEGLAEYYEIGEVAGSSFKTGQVHPPNVETLAKTGSGGLVPLGTFVRQDRRAFYANPTLHYAQAWALVHFLQHGPRGRGRLFDDLFECLASGVRARAAIERVFGDVDLQDLDEQFRAYVRELDRRK